MAYYHSNQNMYGNTFHNYQYYNPVEYGAWYSNISSYNAQGYPHSFADNTGTPNHNEINYWTTSFCQPPANFYIPTFNSENNPAAANVKTSGPMMINNGTVPATNITNSYVSFNSTQPPRSNIRKNVSSLEASSQSIPTSNKQSNGDKSGVTNSKMRICPVDKNVSIHKKCPWACNACYAAWRRENKKSKIIQKCNKPCELDGNILRYFDTMCIKCRYWAVEEAKANYFENSSGKFLLAGYQRTCAGVKEIVSCSRKPLLLDIPSSGILTERFDNDRELCCNEQCNSAGTIQQPFSLLSQSESLPPAHQSPIPIFDSPGEMETPLNFAHDNDINKNIPSIGEEAQMNIYNSPILSMGNIAPIDIDHCHISRLFHRPCTIADQEWFCPAFVEKWSREFGNQSLIIRLNDQYIEVGPSHQKIIRDWLHRCAKIVFARHVVAPKNRNFCSLLLEYDTRPIAVFTYNLSEKKDTGDLTIHFHLFVIEPDHVERNLMEYLLKELLPRYHPKCTMYEIVCVEQVQLWFTRVFAPVLKHIVQDQTVVEQREYITSPVLDCTGSMGFKCPTAFL